MPTLSTMGSANTGIPGDDRSRLTMARTGTQRHRRDARMFAFVCRLHLLDELVGLRPKAEARDGIEIGAGDADHPGLLGMPRGVQHARPVGAGVAGAEAVMRHRLEHGVLLTLRIDPPPFGHL